MTGAELGLAEWVPPEAEQTEKSVSKPGRLRKLGGLALRASGMVLATAVAVGGGVYGADVMVTRTKYDNSHSYLIENSPVPHLSSPDGLPVPQGVYRSLDATEKAAIDTLALPPRLVTFNNPGFGLVDTYRADVSLDAFDAYGANVSVHYGNEGLNVHETAEQENEYIQQNRIEEAGMYADSMGTIFELKTAVELLRLNDKVRLPYIILDSPAIDPSVLRPKSRSDAYTLINNMHIPGASYSRILRLAAEVYLRKDQINDIESFKAVFRESYNEVFDNDDMAVNALLEDQAQMIFSPSVEGDLKELGKLPPERRPVIVFMGAADPARDDVVDTPKSYALLKKWTEEAGLTLLGPYGIKDFYHGAQWRSSSEYHSILSDQVMPDIVSALAVQRSPGPADTSVLFTTSEPRAQAIPTNQLNYVARPED